MLEALERRMKQFRSREQLWPLRVPREPVPLDDVIEEALGEDRARFDPMTLKSRTLLHLRWDDGSTWEVWVCALPSGMKLFCDTGESQSHVLASGGRNAGDDTDRLFLERLAESAGEDFGIEMAGGAPSRVRSSIDDRPFLIDVFVNLFEVTGVESSIRGGAKAADFRTDVEQWLGHALNGS